MASKKMRLKGIDLERPLAAALNAVEPKPPESATREQKHAYAMKLSRELATLVARALRPKYPGILPREDDTGHESATLGAKGKKRIDVKVWDTDKGLELLVSIKTYSFRDWSTKKQHAHRYTKNIKRNRFELQDEAVTIHRRQPFAVMVAIVFMPITACDDGDPEKTQGAQGISSFAHAVTVLRSQAGRRKDDDPAERFERIYIGLYEYDDPSHRGEITFFDVEDSPPRAGRPTKVSSLVDIVEDIVRITTERHTDVIEWDVSYDELEAEVEAEDGDSDDES